MCLIMLISVLSILYDYDFLYVVMGWWMLINVLKWVYIVCFVDGGGICHVMLMMISE